MNVINIKLKTIITKIYIILIGFLFIKDKKKKIDRNKLKLRINDKIYDIKFPFKRIRKFKFIGIVSNFYIVKIPIADLITDNIHNRPIIIYEDENENNYEWSLRYSIFNRIKYFNSKIQILKDKNTSVYVRQTAKNRLTITVRKINKTDSAKEQMKINLACFLAKFVPKRKILLYEKEGERFEESASIIYKKLIDENYKDIYYIINKDNPILNKIDDKYKNNFIYKYTFKHYLAFFSAKAFIGTESPGHAIELRIANKRAACRIYKGNFQYVFLQHGVMYMVSLDSKGRSFFRKDGGMPKKSKIVVSSQEEANHFINLGGFLKNDLYITGLPKYDENKYHENADKIVIMPTWRPWEYNLMRNGIEESPYYKMIDKIIKSIPENLKDKIILMPHPLVLDYLRQSDLSKYILDDFVYNEVLEDTKVLITDYSSIAYDAFYRGGTVIFYWEEKDFCMEQYGGHLMLNEENVFGPVCYNENQLSSTISEYYDKTIPKIYKDRYLKIVEFNDNKNTTRLIEKLKQDNIIKQ